MPRWNGKPRYSLLFRRIRARLRAVAKVVVDPKSLPDRAVPIPGAKPPVFSLPCKDLGHPEEVDEFRELIREIRRQNSTRVQ